MEEIEHAVVNALKPHPNLVNAFPQEIGLRSSQFVAELLQLLQTHPALVLRLWRHGAKPVQEGHASILSPEKDDFRSRHSATAQLRKFAKLCQHASQFQVIAIDAGLDDGRFFSELFLGEDLGLALS